jgi:hypothetical protein
MAAASLDDVAAATGKAGTKAAGVVIDDTAVTPRYLTGFTPDRELPIIWRIAKGSLKNKIVFILPAALLLSYFLPVLITPILMIGGTYLCYEGVEKLLEAFTSHADESDGTVVAEAAELTSAEHEEAMASGAIRTDFILSAEIMAIALKEVADKPIAMQASILAMVAIMITLAVYGVVGLIVKMDDIGLYLAKAKRGLPKALGRGLVKFMPYLLKFLSAVGTAAMIWVGGGIILHGMEEFGFKSLPHAVYSLADQAGAAVPFAHGLIVWLVSAIGAGILGVILGAICVALHHALIKVRQPKAV